MFWQIYKPQASTILEAMSVRRYSILTHSRQEAETQYRHETGDVGYCAGVKVGAA